MIALMKADKVKHLGSEILQGHKMQQEQVGTAHTGNACTA